MKLVELHEAKARLRITHDDQNEDIRKAIDGASESVMRYVGADEDTFDDGVPENVQNAVIVWVGLMMHDPLGFEAHKWGHGYPPPAVVALLHGSRDPVFA
jgi:hypothetical protein